MTMFLNLEPWFDMYLRYRNSIVLNHNPFIAFNPDPTTNDPVSFTYFVMVLHHELVDDLNEMLHWISLI